MKSQLIRMTKSRTPHSRVEDIRGFYDKTPFAQILAKSKVKLKRVKN